MIEWWCDEKDVSNRAEGVSLGKEFYATGILKHGMWNRIHKNKQPQQVPLFVSFLSAATDLMQNFKDAAEFYRFTADEGHEGPKEKDRKQTLVSSSSKMNFELTEDSPCKTITVSRVSLCVCVCVW